MHKRMPADIPGTILNGILSGTVRDDICGDLPETAQSYGIGMGPAPFGGRVGTESITQGSVDRV